MRNFSLFTARDVRLQKCAISDVGVLSDILDFFLPTGMKQRLINHIGQAAVVLQDKSPRGYTVWICCMYKDSKLD